MNTERFKQLIKKAKNIVLSTHLAPDADGIGSEVALALAFRTLGINCICVNQDKLDKRYDYLDPEGMIISCDEYVEKYSKKEIDLFIVVDTNALERIGEKVQHLVSSAKELLFIDHHPCPQEFYPIHCIDSRAAATGELVGNLIETLGVSFTKEMALPLYTAILIDTSSFRYPTVTGDTHRLIAKLMDTGIESSLAYNLINGTRKISHMQLLGLLLEDVQTTNDQAIAWLSLNESQMAKFNVEPEDTYSFVNHLLILDNVKIVCMFLEQESSIKISFRSTGDVDVGIMAQALGGGGHNHSAATSIEGDLKEVIKETINKLQIILKGFYQEPHVL